MNERNHYCKEVDVQLGRRISTDRQVAPKESRGAKGLCVKKEGREHEDEKYIDRKIC